MTQVKIDKIISGGQTGADQGGLWAARALGIPTGGWAPHGWLTENGPQRALLESFRLVEHSKGYRDRTIANLLYATATIIIADRLDRGSRLTEQQCEAHGRPCHVMSKARLGFATERAVFLEFIRENFHGGGILNVAGNRESRSPGIQNSTERFLVETLPEMEHL